MARNGSTSVARSIGGVGEIAGEVRANPSFLASLRVLPRMLRAIRGGEYRPAVPRVLLGLVTLGYVVSPVDLLPEVLLGPLGMADDATLAITAFAGLLAAETAAFLAWERGN